MSDDKLDISAYLMTEGFIYGLYIKLGHPCKTLKNLNIHVYIRTMLCQSEFLCFRLNFIIDVMKLGIEICVFVYYKNAILY